MISEQLRENDKQLRRVNRDVERDRTKLEREEKKIEADIKKAAKAGNKERIWINSSLDLWKKDTMYQLFHELYRVSHLLVDLVVLTWILSVPLTARFCLG